MTTGLRYPPRPGQRHVTNVCAAIKAVRKIIDSGGLFYNLTKRDVANVAPDSNDALPAKKNPLPLLLASSPWLL